MSTLSAVFPTLLDIARGLDPKGRAAMVAEVLQQYNAMLDDIPWVEGNLPTGHQSTIRTSKPAGSFRLLNSGVLPTKSTTGVITNTCAILEAWSQIDVDMPFNGDLAGFRFQQERGFMEGLSDTFASKLIYGDSGTTPEEFDGFASRYFSLGTTYTTSTQLIDAGGDGTDNMSIWLVCWGPGKVYGIYPKGSKAGLNMEDHGEVTITDPNNAGYFMRVYESKFQWKCGIAVDDYRYVARICNIDRSNLLTASDGSDTSANILKYMSQALDYLPPDSNVRPVFYMNRDTMSMLRIKMQDKSNLQLTTDGLAYGIDGITRRPTLQFQGIPCRRMDSLTYTETEITAGTTGPASVS